MKLSTRSRYGVRLMTDLADQYGRGQIFLKDIARREDISEKYLSLIVIPLRTAGLIQSTRGSRGGYRLARKPEEISIADILSVLEDGMCLVDCVHDPHACSRVDSCPTRDVWIMLEEKMIQAMASITLADLVRTRQQKADNTLMSHI